MITRRVALQAAAGGTAGLLSGCLLGGESTVPVKIGVRHRLEERIGVHIEIENEDGQSVVEQTVHAMPSDDFPDSDDRWTVPLTTVSDTFVIGQEYRFHVTIVDTDTYEEGKSSSKRGCIPDPEVDEFWDDVRFSVRLRPSAPGEMEILQYMPTC